MTCAHVLGLIDAGPVADYPRAYLNAARRHAAECATCGPALKAATSLSADLFALPQPTAPPDLAAAILSRIAYLERQRLPSAGVIPRERAPFNIREWSAGATVAGGLATGLAVIVSVPLANDATIDITSLIVRGMTVDLLATPTTSIRALVLVAGLVLYIAGLFGVVGGARPERSIVTKRQ